MYKKLFRQSRKSYPEVKAQHLLAVTSDLPKYEG